MRFAAVLAALAMSACADGGVEPGDPVGGSPPVATGLAAYRFRSTLVVGSEPELAVPLSFDHASLVAGGKALADGGDVRVAVEVAGALSEIDRVLDPVSSWDAADTRIWFRARADADAYHLYYGNEMPDAPLADGRGVYLWWDDFDGELDASWELITVGGASGSATPMDGALRLSGVSGAIGSTSDDFVFAARQLSGDFIADVAVVGAGGSLGAFAKLGGVMVRQSPLSDARHCTMSIQQSPRAYVAAVRPVDGMNSIADAQVPIDDSFPRYLAAYRYGSDVAPQFADDGVTLVTLGAVAPLGLTDPAFVGIPFANLSAGEGWVDVDWFRVRRLPAGTISPNAALGAEQTLF
jgi:hypothetical protein